MNTLLKLANQPSTFGNREGALYPLFEDLDGFRIHFLDRKREIEDLITLMNLRVEAEFTYSNQLFDIAESDQYQSITIGTLGQEVDAFKEDCRSKAKAAAELATNVAQDCCQPLRVLMDEQDLEFKQIVNDSREKIQGLDFTNNQIRKMAHRYFEASENAEKFIHNYQELKLNVEVPYIKRKSLHQSVQNTMNIAKERETDYSNSLAVANEALANIVEDLKQNQLALAKFEAERCEQIHSSINQFVVFEKFAEMNNKYDVKHFSDLIDTFTVTKEMELINDLVTKDIVDNRVPLAQTIFDPIIDEKDRQKGIYEFAKYRHKRYEISEMAEDHPNVVGPPTKLAEHGDKKELINFTLDKAFLPQNLNQEYVEAAQEIFKSEANRQQFLTFMEEDYTSYGLSYLSPVPVHPSIKVSLPYVIFKNLSQLFYAFMDVLDQVPPEQDTTNHLMRLILFANLFHCQTPSGSNIKPASLLKTLSSAEVLKEDKVWMKIVELRIAAIDGRIKENNEKDKSETETRVEMEPSKEVVAIIKHVVDDLIISGSNKDRIIKIVRSSMLEGDVVEAKIRSEAAFQADIVTLISEIEEHFAPPPEVQANAAVDLEAPAKSARSTNPENPFEASASAEATDDSFNTPGAASRQDTMAADTASEDPTPKRNSQWLGGIESFLGGGYAGLPDARVRSQTFASLTSKVSSVGTKVSEVGTKVTPHLSNAGSKAQNFYALVKSKTLTASTIGNDDMPSTARSQEGFEFEDPNQSPEIDADLKVAAEPKKPAEFKSSIKPQEVQIKMTDVKKEAAEVDDKDDMGDMDMVDDDETAEKSDTNTRKMAINLSSSIKSSQISSSTMSMRKSAPVVAPKVISARAARPTVTAAKPGSTAATRPGATAASTAAAAKDGPQKPNEEKPKTRRTYARMFLNNKKEDPKKDVKQDVAVKKISLTK